ncbi:acetyl-CoA carboxylase biotin carboxylase subunit [Stomatohabitans albus]|uniref:acetyl-CoA carboxylase biotin carboxylase subunit n=1 Tax=Stomatohabitans albus TaxID=3110766 RepID=UPI00300CAEA9
MQELLFNDQLPPLDGFGPVLVANRGEIALRVFRTCRDLGLKSIAVYSEADAEAPWLHHADEAYLIGSGPAADSYLNVDHILEAIERSGAKAVHPGYGFLSENVDFANAVVEAGCTWIGPSPDSINSMGDKISAREAAVAADCPIVPGLMEPTSDPEVVKAFAQEHGYPLIIKAAYGGGGRGMKVVRADRDLVEALESAQREAVTAFGRGEVYVERYLEHPRHVEVQILADQQGNTLYLGDRDCTLQRRHQKLIEEAPAPGIPDEIRKAMGESSVRVAKAVGYTTTGTCEYLYQDGEFYFLEMNTRLQVEHPVTEEVIGIDLVEWQFRTAAGQSLPFGQDDIFAKGHAIEARINAENVGLGFVPSPGLITKWVPPQGPGVRMDSVGTTGWEIPRIYDSLIGKVIVQGRTRDQARRRLIRALHELQIEGVPTTVDFFNYALVSPDFIQMQITTNTVERDWDLSSIEPALVPNVAEEAASRHNVVVEVDGKRIEVTVRGLMGAKAAAATPKRRTRSGSSGPSNVGAGTITAPMQGTVVKVNVSDGETVEKDQTLVVLEAMKMENAIKAPHAGIVKDVAVAVGDTVNTGQAMVTVDAEGDEG